MTNRPQITLLPRWDSNYRRIPYFLTSIALYLAMMGSIVLLTGIVQFTEFTPASFFGVPLILFIIVFYLGHSVAVHWGRTYNIGLRHKWTRIGLIAGLLIPYVGVLILLFFVFAPEDTYYGGIDHDDEFLRRLR